MLMEMKKYKEWKEVPVSLVDEVKKERRREIKYRKKRSAANIEDIIVFLISKHDLHPSIIEIIADNKLFLKTAWEEGTEIIEENSTEKRRKIEKKNNKREASFLGNIEEMEIPNKVRKVEISRYIATEEQTSFLGNIEEMEIKKGEIMKTGESESEDVEEMERIREEMIIDREEGNPLYRGQPLEGVRELSSLNATGHTELN